MFNFLLIEVLFLAELDNIKRQKVIIERETSQYDELFFDQQKTFVIFSLIFNPKFYLYFLFLQKMNNPYMTVVFLDFADFICEDPYTDAQKH